MGTTVGLRLLGVWEGSWAEAGCMVGSRLKDGVGETRVGGLVAQNKSVWEVSLNLGAEVELRHCLAHPFSLFMLTALKPQGPFVGLLCSHHWLSPLGSVPVATMVQLIGPPRLG